MIRMGEGSWVNCRMLISVEKQRLPGRDLHPSPVWALCPTSLPRSNAAEWLAACQGRIPSQAFANGYPTDGYPGNIMDAQLENGVGIPNWSVGIPSWSMSLSTQLPLQGNLCSEN
jgi:hypothetical protein